MKASLLLRFTAWPALVLAAACASTSEQPSAEKVSPAEPPSIRRVLTETDLVLRLWNNSLLGDPDEKMQKQAEAAERAIAKVVQDRFDEFVAQLETGARRNRAIAAAALGFGKDAKALPYLVRALRESESEIVGNALLGLGVLGSKETPLEPLLEALLHHPSAEVRNDAAFCLKRLVEAGLAGEGLASGLQAALRDPEAGVRAQSAAALGILREAGSTDSLIPLLGDAKPLVASAAAFALGRIKNHRAFEPLRNALESHSPRVREAAYKALVELTGEDRGPNAWNWR